MWQSCKQTSQNDGRPRCSMECLKRGSHLFDCMFELTLRMVLLLLLLQQPFKDNIGHKKPLLLYKSSCHLHNMTKTNPDCTKKSGLLDWQSRYVETGLELVVEKMRKSLDSTLVRILAVEWKEKARSVKMADSLTWLERLANFGLHEFFGKNDIIVPS